MVTWTQTEKTALLQYCESDVVALTQLLPKSLPQTSLPHALLRGRYMRAAAKMEYQGVPVDRETLDLLNTLWGPFRPTSLRMWIEPMAFMRGAYSSGIGLDNG
jgi:hypothetical protein